MSYKKTVQKALADFSKGDIPSIINICDDNIVWVNPDAPEVPFCISVNGKNNVPQFFSKLGETVNVSRFEIDNFIEEGNKVVAWGSYDATVKSTGKPFTTPLIMTWEFNSNGKCTKWQAHSNTSAQAKAFSEN